MYTEIAKNKRSSYFLITCFILIIIGLCWVFSLALASQTVLYLGVAFAIIYAVSAYFSAGKVVLAISKAKPIEKKDNPALYRTVENLAITAGLPAPKIYIINDPAPNAFATGRDPKNAVICVTTGLLEILTKTELEGVIAHEMSHIGNYDIRFMTLVVVMVGIVVLLADIFIRVSVVDGDSDSSAGSAIFLLAILLALITPLIGIVMQFSFSRKREYLADSTAVLLTRYPEGLASALEKLEADTKSPKEANRATTNLFIVNPLRNTKKKGPASWFSGLFSTHPSTADRIERLRKMETHA